VEHALELGGAHLIFRRSLLLGAARDPLAFRVDRARKLIRIGKQRALIGGARAELPA